MGGKRWYTCNYRYFKDIGTREKAYWLGFILADGCVVHTERIRHLKTMDSLQIREYFQLSLSDIDRGHLEKLSAHMDSTYPINTYSVVAGFHTNNKYSRIVIEDHDLFNDLVAHGVIPNKSLHEKYPEIPHEFDFDLIRGIFDADGCLSSHTNRHGTLDFEFSFTSTREILTVVCQKLGLTVTEHTFKPRFPERGTNNFSAKYCGNQQIERTMDLLYKDAPIYLDRKYNKYIALKKYMQSRQS